MKQNKIKLIKYYLLFMFILTIFSFPNVEPVMAVEAEDEDNFTTMPNYRWFNETTTSATVDEHLEQDLYIIDSVNNETTGSLDFEKSRGLNSRDFYFESRFQMDIGGNQSEYFRDVLGDKADFEEDMENTIASGGGVTLSQSDGLLIVETTTQYEGFSFTLLPISPRVYSSISFRIKGDGSYNMWWLSRELDNTPIDYFSSVLVTTEWQSFTQTFTTKTLNIGIIRLTTSTDSNNINRKTMIDSIEINGDLDYATHVEDEVEDTWDWEDSSEYWYDEESNVSDFDDGSLEMWDYWEVEGSYNSINEDGWIKTDNDFTFSQIGADGLSIDANVYDWLTFEFYFISATPAVINDVTIHDNVTGVNVVWTDSPTDYENDTKYLISAHITDPDWTDVETQLEITFSTNVSILDYYSYVNMTYLYDVELGDVEGFARIGGSVLRYDYVNPVGYVSILPNNLSNFMNYVESGLSIDSLVFTEVVIRTRANEENLRMAFYDGVNTLGTYFPVTTEFDEYRYTLTDDNDWLGIETSFGLSFAEVPGQGNFEGNERYDIDYILLLGHWSETDGFKYSLLTRYHEEGMYFQFTNPEGVTGQYQLNIDMLGTTGVELSYSCLFSYTMNDGWLYLDVEWHLDKKKIKVVFAYENGTTIIKTRSMYDLFGSTGRERLILLESGFPRLCLNNTIGSLAKSLFVIDYVDADWKLIDWQEPEDSFDEFYGSTIQQESVSYFDSMLAYGASSFEKDVNDRSHWYQLSVTRFDGLSFNARIEASGLDIDTGDDDRADFIACVYNVGIGGSLRPVFQVWMDSTGGSPDSTRVTLKNGTGAGTELFSNDWAGETNIEMKFVVALESEDTAIVQFEATSGGVSIRRTGAHRYNFTDEWVIRFAYYLETENIDYADDYIDIVVSGFELARKDWIRDIVVAVLSPLIGVFMLLLTPFIILFNGLMLVIIKSFGALLEGIVTGLGGFLTTLGTALTTAMGEIAGAVWALMSGVLNSINGTLGGMASAIWGLFSVAIAAINTTLMGLVDQLFIALWLLADDLASLLEEVLLTLMSSLITLLEELFAQLSLFVDYFINDFLIPIFAEIIESLGLTELFQFIGTWLEGIVGIMVSLLQLVFALWGYIWAAGAFWLVPARFQAVALVLMITIVIWVFYPLLTLFADFAAGDFDFDRTTDSFETIFSHIGSIFSTTYTILVFMVDMFVKIINVIANFIPFT